MDNDNYCIKYVRFRIEWNDIKSIEMASLADILIQNASILTLNAKNRIVCKVTGHEMPANLQIVLGHINNKKFKKQLVFLFSIYFIYLLRILIGMVFT